MKDFKSFLKNISKDSDKQQIWKDFQDFCKNIITIDSSLLVQSTPNLMDWVDAQGMYYLFFKGIEEACEKNLEKIKTYYEGLVSSNNTVNYKVLDRLLATVFKYDRDWSVEQISKLLDSTNSVKLSKGITSVGYLNLMEGNLDDFITNLEHKFQSLTKTDLSNNLKANLLFAYRVQRKHLLSADDYIKISLNSNIDEIKVQLIQALCYDIDVDTEPEFFKEVLMSMVTVNHKLLGGYNLLAYKLEQAIEKHYEVIIDFLNTWVSQSSENAAQIILFRDVFNELYAKNPPKFFKLATQWINQDKINFQIAIFKIFQEIGYRGVNYIHLDQKLLKSYSFQDIEFIIKKIIGFEYDKDRLNSMLYSILENTYGNQEALNLVGGYYVNYLIFNYYSSIDFLEEKRKKASSKLKKIIDEIIDKGKKSYNAYSDLEFLKEFEPSEQRMNYMNRLQAKKFRKDQEEHEKNDTGFLSMITKLSFRSGKTAFGKFDGEYSPMMEPKLISHSTEMPRGEFIDPVGQKLTRMDGQIFMRRK